MSERVEYLPTVSLMTTNKDGVQMAISHRVPAKELIGLTVNYLTLVEPAGVDKRHRSIWKAKCVCGNFKVVRVDSLRIGQPLSCGCAGSAGSVYDGTRLNKKYAISRTP